MGLAVDDKSITTAAGFVHYKELADAVGAKDLPAKKQAVLAFRTEYNSRNLQDDEKGLVKVITRTITKTKKSMADSFAYAVAVKQKLGTSNMDTVRDAIDKLGSYVSEWLDAFGAGGNMIGGLGVIAAAVGTANSAWVQNVPQASRNVKAIKEGVEGLLAAQFKNTEIRNLWAQFPGADAVVLWTLVEKAPAALYAAYQHIGPVNPDPFWLIGFGDPAKAKLVADKVYSDNAYVTKPKPVNAIATKLTTAIEEPWVKLFTCLQLAEIHEKLVAAGLDPLADRFFGTAGTIATTHKPVAETDDFQKWISKNCNVVTKLARDGYSINAIMKMFDKGMSESQMISCTWFRRNPITASLDFFLRVWEDPGNHKKGTIHGGLSANGAHLAVRHLYDNFKFDQIEHQNSFHPRHTTAGDLVTIANNLTLDHKNQNSKQLVGNYYVVVTNHDKPGERRVKSLYPSLATTHPDYYTRTELENIRDVLVHVTLGLPEL